MKRTEIIKAIIKDSSSYRVKNVDFKEEGEYILVESTQSDKVFYAVELINMLSAFNSYLETNENGKVIFRVY